MAEVTALYAYLRQRDIKQTDLADLTGIGKERISRICRGQYRARPQEKQTISTALQVDIEQLWPFERLSHLPTEDKQIEKLCEWLKGKEGRLFWRRIQAIL